MAEYDINKNIPFNTSIYYFLNLPLLTLLCIMAANSHFPLTTCEGGQ